MWYRAHVVNPGFDSEDSLIRKRNNKDMAHTYCRKFLLGRKKFLVYMPKYGNVYGYIMLKESTKDPKKCAIMELATDTQKTGFGISTQLMKKLQKTYS